MVAGAEGSPVFDYTSLDFSSVERDMIRYAQSRFPDDIWTDLNASNEGRRLIELMAYATDLLSYSANAHVKETIISSLVREQNFRNIAKTFDYALNSASPATTTLRFTLDGGFLPLVIPSTFQVADTATSAVIFQPDVEGTAVATTYDVDATQGTGIVNEALATSDGTTGQSYQLAQTSLIDGTLSVTVGAAPYELITNFISAEPSDKTYIIATNEDSTTTLTFGDGINGIVPPLGQSILATYKVGGGLQGNFPTGAIEALVSSLPGVLSVTNITAAEGGGPKQTLANARRNLPLSIKANERAVTLQDYATLTIDLVSGVLNATAVAGIFQAGGNPVILFVVPNGGGTVSSSLANSIVTTLRYGTSAADPGRSLAGRRIFVRDPVYVDLLITADVFVQKGSKASVVGERVDSALTIRYALENSSFGEAVDTQDAYNTVDPVEQSIAGLQRVFLRQFSIRSYCGRYVTNPTSGNGAAVEITTLPTVTRREWNVTMTSVSTFEVKQRRLGTISAIGDSSIEDESAAYVTDELVTTVDGWRLHVREQEQSTLFDIAANTQSSITTTTPGILVLATNGDSYAVERVEPTAGKVLRTTVNGAALANQPVITVASATGFVANDEVLVTEAGGETAVMQILTVVGLVVTFTTDLPFALATSDTVDWFWRAEDGTAGFAIVQGSTLFVNGDQFYVDTYPVVGDIQLRPENFPLLASADLDINTIGGVR